MSAPLIALVTLCYIGVAADQFMRGHYSMCLIWAGYSIANVGFYLDLK